MTDPGITLNIYNKPPQFEDNVNNNINETEAELNATSALPPKELVDNTRPDETSAPKANNGFQFADNTRNNTEESSANHPNNNQPIPFQQYPQPIIGYPPPPIRAIPYTPVQAPIMQPYNPQYAQPVIIQQRANNQPQNAVIIKQTKNQDNTADCCAGFLAGCGGVLAACCLLSLCAGRGRGRRGRW